MANAAAPAAAVLVNERRVIKNGRRIGRPGAKFLLPGGRYRSVPASAILARYVHRPSRFPGPSCASFYTEGVPMRTCPSPKPQPVGGGASFVPVVKSVDLGYLDHASPLWSLDGAWLWRVLVQTPSGFSRRDSSSGSVGRCV